MDDEPRSPTISRGGLLIALKREQLLLACALRGMSLEELRQEARLSRPTFQAAIRGKRVRPRTLLKIAQALKRIPVLDEASQLVTGAVPAISRSKPGQGSDDEGTPWWLPPV